MFLLDVVRHVFMVFLLDVGGSVFMVCVLLDVITYVLMVSFWCMLCDMCFSCVFVGSCLICLYGVFRFHVV